jgi:hypothetical protein
MKSKKRNYNARWYTPGLTKLADVSFSKVSDEAAIAEARRTGKELNLPNTAFELYEGHTRLVHSGV